MIMVRTLSLVAFPEKCLLERVLTLPIEQMQAPPFRYTAWLSHFLSLLSFMASSPKILMEDYLFQT